MSKISADLLRSLLDYEPETGAFRWKVNVANKKAGQIAGGWHGGASGNRYIVIGLKGKTYLAHRLAWLHTFGCWPKDQIDHINGCKSDNRLCNLREATTEENHQNMPVSKRNRSGAMGVSWCRHTNRWLAMIAVSGRRLNLGRFDTVEEASRAYRMAKLQLHTFQPTLRDEIPSVAMQLREVRG